MMKRKRQKTEEPVVGQKIILELISYNREQYAKYTELTIDDLLKQLQPSQVNWLNLDGLQDHSIIKKLQDHFSIDSMLVDDILHDQRPKAEEFESFLFFTLKMLYRIDGYKIDYEQVSFVLGNNFLLSFQEKEGDLFGPLRERIRLDQGYVRKKNGDYLLYRLIDIIIDNYYTVLDNIGEQIEDIDEAINNDPSNRTFHQIQAVKKELIYLRKAVYPLRDALSKIVKGESEFIEDENIRYYSDIYSHIAHLIDSLDTYKDLTSSLMDIHINTMNTRMNEVMKVLTVFSTIFMPLTFIVGVYGMNFDNMPELRWSYGYFIVLGVMILITGAMLKYFRHKKWF